MPIIIEDGKGRGWGAGVNPRHKLLTASETNLTSHFVSDIDGRAFNMNSVVSSAAAGDAVFYMINTDSDRDCFIDLIRVGSLNAALWKFWAVTGTGSGAAITPTNLNRKSGVTATSTVLGSGAVTGLTFATLIATVRTTAAGSVNVPFDDILILGANNTLAVEYDTGTTGACEVLVRCFYRGFNEGV